MVPNETEAKSTVSLHFCEPGQVLAAEVRNSNGQKIVPKGKKLNEKILRRLTSAGVKRVTIFAESEGKEEVVERKKTETKKRRQNIIKETSKGLVVTGDLTEDFKGEEDIVVEGDVYAGATLETTGNIQIEGAVNEGTLCSREGMVNVQGEVTGKNIRFEAEKFIRLPSVEQAEVSMEGNVVIRGPVTEADIECLGNMVIHHDEVKARVVDSELKVEGKLFADEVDANKTDGSQLFFRDPEKQAVRRRQKELKEQIEELEQEFSKLRKVVNTVKQLGDKVKELSTDKKNKLKQHMSRFKKIQNRLSQSRNQVDECEATLEELKQERRYFMRVLNTLRKSTSITMENTMINLDEDEWNVQLYKKSMIVVQAVDNLPDDEFDELSLLKG